MGGFPLFGSFILVTFTIMVTGDRSCPSSMCSDQDHLEIQFPFSFYGGQQDRCGYPGFDLSCDSTNRTVLELGSSGEFFIRGIDYTTQQVQIYDQHNCLPERLMNLNLSGTPFTTGVYSQDLSFFSCSSNSSLGNIEPISCLSSINQTVYATSSMGRARYMASVCELIATVMVPSEWAFYELGYYDDLILTWNVPDCRECLKQGGKCGFKNNESNDIKCSNIPRRRGFSKAVTYILIIGVGVPTLICFILVACYLWRRFKPYGGSRHHRRHLESSVLPQPAIFVVGLDESVIQSYPKTVLGESRRLDKPDDNTCPICLSEYQPKETLRTIPDCKHCFHATCIDKWLRKNSTCPLCRNSPVPVSPPV